MQTHADAPGPPDGCVPRSSKASAGILGAVLVVGLAACGSPGTGSGSAGSAGSAAGTPSPTPIDVAQAFRQRVAGGLTAEATVTGTIDLGTNHGTLSGTYTFGNEGYRYDITTTIGSVRTMTRQVVIGGTTYEQDGDGPWLVKVTGTGGSPAASASPAASDADLSTLVDAGVVTVGGQRVHALAAPVRRSGSTGPSGSATGGGSTVRYYARDDGTPVGMEVTTTWTQGPASHPVTGRTVMEIIFTTLGGKVDVNPPDEVWVVYASKQFPLTIAHPPDWTAQRETGDDWFTAPDQSAALEVAGMKTGMSQTQWQNDSAADVFNRLKVRADASFSISVGGVVTKAVEYHAKLDGQPSFLIDVPVVHAGFGYDLYWIGAAGYETQDIETLKAFVASLTFTR